LGVSPYSYNSSNGSYTYDNNGNTLTDAAGKQYTWDFENRLVQAVVSGTGTTTFKYDPFGRRIQKAGPLGTTNYLYDGANLIQELDNTGSLLARYTQRQGVDEALAELRSGSVSYYEPDGLGSITSLTGASGTIANTYAYDSFGKLAASSGTIVNPFQYTARDYDAETSLRYYRARYYDPLIGRFISQDPAGYNAGMNIYRYVRNNPVLFGDPSGLCEVLARIRLWSTDAVTIASPRSPWVLSITHQDNADGIVFTNPLWCHWTREYNAWIQTTTTYLVISECTAAGCPEKKDLFFYTEKETTYHSGTTTKTFDFGMPTITGFDSDFLEVLYCKAHPPSP
jgi:RHS repeat-associated protein